MVFPRDQAYASNTVFGAGPASVHQCFSSKRLLLATCTVPCAPHACYRKSLRGSACGSKIETWFDSALHRPRCREHSYRRGQGIVIWSAIVIGLVVAAMVIISLVKRSRSIQTASPYIKADHLVSPAERSFLGVLEQAAGTDFRVFAKVRVADIVAVRKGLPPGDRQRAFNRISSKHFDFVVCSPDDLAVLGVIELDDKSHKARKRRERDQFIADTCSAVSLPLVRVAARRSYAISELRQQLLASCGSRPTGIAELANVRMESQAETNLDRKRLKRERTLES